MNSLPELQRKIRTLKRSYISGDLNIHELRRELEKLRRLCPEPLLDLQKFDVSGLLCWTFPMALAWIIWRSEENVRRFLPAYQEAQRIWGTELISRDSSAPFSLGESIESLIRPPSDEVLRDLATEAATDASVAVRFDEAKIELWRALDAATDLKVQGFSEQYCRWVEIPHEEFADLRLCSAKGYESELLGRRAPASYSSPSLGPVDLKRRWKAQSTREISSKKAAREFREFFWPMVARSPDECTITRRDALEEARKRPGLHDLQERLADRVRKQVLAELGAEKAWSGGGRPKKKPPRQKSPRR